MFEIVDDKSLSYVLRKIKELKTEQNRIEELASHEINRIKEWKEKELSGITDSISSFNNIIEQYAIEQRLNDPKFKKLSTPYGTVKFRKQQNKWDYGDEEKLLEKLIEEGYKGFIRNKQEINKEKIRELCFEKNGHIVDRDTGEVIDGIEVVKLEDKIVIEVE